MRSCQMNGWSSLGLLVSVVLVVWSLVLPWIGSLPSIREQIDDFERQGIDPAALYYTDLEAMGRLESDVAAIRQAHPAAFWGLGASATD